MIFSTARYEYLAHALSQLSKRPVGRVERRVFPDGERYQRIHENLWQKDVWLVGGTTTDSDFLELYDLACALVKYGAQSLTLVVPYFGYSTMEREVQAGEVLPAKTRARLFSVIPQSPQGNRIVLLDPHTPGLPHYFEGNLKHVLVSASEALVDHCHKWIGAPFVLVAPDAGRAKDVEILGEKRNISTAFMLKSRKSGTDVKVHTLFGNVKGQIAVLSDDMIRSGSTLKECARLLLENGAQKVYAMATHGVLPGAAAQQLRDSQLFEGILVTDSHTHTQELHDPFFEVVSCAPMVVEKLKFTDTAHL